MKRSILLASLLCQIPLWLSAATEEPAEKPAAPPAETKPDAPEPAKKAEPAATRFAPLSVEQENAFALALMNNLSKKAQAGQLPNSIFCPGGVSRLLRALHAGGKGKTSSEIGHVLGVASAPAAEATTTSAPAGDSPVLKTVSGLWGDAAFPFAPGFQQAATEALGAHAETIPLAQHPAESLKTINAWAEQGTGGAIHDLLKPQDLRGTKLVLADAAWFKDAWLKPFAAERTLEDDWTLPDGKKRRVSYVSDRRRARIGSTPLGEVLSLPFATARFECLCLLPAMKPKETPGAALLRFERALKPETIAEFVAALAEQPVVDLRLPKIDLKGLSANLIPALQAMGVKAAFTDAADFSPMATKGVDLKVGVFRQDTAFRLDENGAEASAATVGALIGKGAAAPVPVFHADRPALFVIRDTESGAVVFLVRCAAPAEVQAALPETPKAEPAPASKEPAAEVKPPAAEKPAAEVKPVAEEKPEPLSGDGAPGARKADPVPVEKTDAP